MERYPCLLVARAWVTRSWSQPCVPTRSREHKGAIMTQDGEANRLCVTRPRCCLLRLEDTPVPLPARTSESVLSWRGGTQGFLCPTQSSAGLHGPRPGKVQQVTLAVGHRGEHPQPRTCMTSTPPPRATPSLPGLQTGLLPGMAFPRQTLKGRTRASSLPGSLCPQSVQEGLPPALWSLVGSKWLQPSPSPSQGLSVPSPTPQTGKGLRVGPGGASPANLPRMG